MLKRIMNEKKGLRDNCHPDAKEMIKEIREDRDGIEDV